MAEQLEREDHQLMNLTSELIEMIEQHKMKSFFNSANPEDGLRSMHENQVTGKDAIIKNINRQIDILQKIKSLDLEEEAVTAKVKTKLVETIDKAIQIVKEEL